MDDGKTEAALKISTHALTWSATVEIYDAVAGWDFNSRTHVECDPWQTMGQHERFHFNSRTHVECDKSAELAYNIM